MSYIYALLYPDTKAPYYVGRSSDPDRRFEEHKSSSMHTLRLVEKGVMPELKILAHYSGVTDIEAMEFAWINRVLAAGYQLQNTATNSHYNFASDDDDYTVKYDNLYVIKGYAWGVFLSRDNVQTTTPLSEFVVNEDFKPRGRTKMKLEEMRQRKTELLSDSSLTNAVELLTIPGIDL